MNRLAAGVFALLPILDGANGEASGQNLLKNPRFDKNLSSWRALKDRQGAPGEMTWSSLDADGSSLSGSLELRTSALAGRETYSVGQCVSLPTPSDYVVFGGRIRVPPAQQAAGYAYFSVENFSSGDCSGNGGSQSGLEGLANASFWSKRTEFASIRGAASLRLTASLYKRYEWQEGDQTGEIDDHLTLRAFFDDVFVHVTTEANLRNLVESLSTEFPEYRNTGQTVASWGKHTVERPTLSVKALGDDGRERDQRRIELASSDQIRLAISLKAPYSLEDPQSYPLQSLSVAARNNEKNFGRRPTLKFVIYRESDPSKKPVEVAIDESGRGVFESVQKETLSVILTERSEYRLRTLRALFECLKAAHPDAARSGEDPTDDQLLSMPLASYFVSNPPGDYELVATYHALEAGFWHDPVYSEPLRIRIVKKDFKCGKPEKSGRESPSPR